MTPVTIIAMPHNGRCALYEDQVTEDEPYPHGMAPYLTLPIKMPESVFLIYGNGPNEVLAIDVCGEDGGRIRRDDVHQVWTGICQYNADCAREDEQ